MRIVVILATVLVGLAPASAQTNLGPDFFARVREGNALRDAARAEERQADSLRRLERIEHDRALREDREARVRNRDRRDAYRRGDRY